MKDSFGMAKGLNHKFYFQKLSSPTAYLHQELVFWYFQLSIVYLVNYIMWMLSFYCAANRLK